jgi:hypothetical protein
MNDSVEGFKKPTGVKLIVAGSRNISDASIVAQAIMDSGYWGIITEIVSGCAKGVDTLGELIAQANGIPIKKIPAKWKEYGRRAGYLRNEEMGHYADAAIVVRKDGIASKGSTSMIQVMHSLGKDVHVKEV